jgi:HD-GYP domain-containing protein (c-di-GMP phosphodiesterase class II)
MQHMRESDSDQRLLRIISLLTSAISNTRLYNFDHPYVGQYAETAFVEITELLQIDKSTTFFLVGDHIVIKDRPLLSSAPFVEKFISILKEKGVERVTFDGGLPKAELLDFIIGMSTKSGAPLRSTSCIRLGKVKLRIDADAEASAEAGAETAGVTGKAQLAGQFTGHGATELDRMRELYHLVERRKRIDLQGVDDMVRRFITGFLSNISPISLLASVKLAHEYTFTHAVNVGILTIIQARSLGFFGRALHEIGVASMLHDVGKIFVPDEILSKPGRLTAEERAVVETHPVKGARYLMTLDGIPKLAVLAAIEHHRRFDGSGYPAINPQWKPNIVGQMIAIADVFDALRSRRAYSEPKPMEVILDILKKDSGVAFNPHLVNSFLQLISGAKALAGGAG